MALCPLPPVFYVTVTPPPHPTPHLQNTHKHANTCFVFLLVRSSRFVLTAEALDSRTVALNGKDLVVSGNQLPALFPTPGTGDALVMAPQSIAFVVLPGFKGSVCSNGSTGESRK